MIKRIDKIQDIYSTKTRRGIQDFTEIINGKWKLPILITLFEKPYRFKELTRKLQISPRMLTRELQDLEMNKLISRTVYSTQPASVEYAVTKIGLTLKKVLLEIGTWGVFYRKKMRAKE
ncbi:MAG TPA: helix-turn-helix domain-containing protein [Bacteroidia bacterium]|nr:helix-turn-helix domain-containing protein [Bacteroidia bacterium]